MKEKRTEKRCVSCGEVKPANSDYFFYRNKSKGWFNSWCKVCHSAKTKENSKRNNELQRARRNKNKKLKRCSGCGEVEVFGRRRKCDECIKENRRKHHKLEKPLVKKRLKDAMPAWADKTAIKDFYAKRPEGFHVDHIVPIRGKTVCGLHVIDNMQYLTEEDNMRKSNHFSFEYQGVK